MSRQVTERYLRAVNAQETDEEFLTLVTIEHEDLPEPLYLTCNPYETFSSGPAMGFDGVESRGRQYIYLAFEVILPQDDDEIVQRAQITIDNTHRDIVQTIIDLPSAPTLKFEIVLASDPDYVEVSFPDLYLRNAKWAAKSVTAELSGEDINREPYPRDTMSPGRYGGIF